jgi:hypothetical protein
MDHLNVMCKLRIYVIRTRTARIIIIVSARGCALASRWAVYANNTEKKNDVLHENLVIFLALTLGVKDLLLLFVIAFSLCPLSCFPARSHFSDEENSEAFNKSTTFRNTTKISIKTLKLQKQKYNTPNFSSSSQQKL